MKKYNRNTHKFNENSLSFSEILKHVTKNDGTPYSQPSSINAIYLKALKKIFKVYLQHHDLHYSDTEIGKMVTTYDVQHLIYSMLSEAYDDNPNYIINKVNSHKNEK